MVARIQLYFLFQNVRVRVSSCPQEELIFGHAHSDAPKVAILGLLDRIKWNSKFPSPLPPPPSPPPNQGWSRAKAKKRHFPIRAIGLSCLAISMNLYAYTSPLVPLSSSSCTLEIEYALMCTESQLAPKWGRVCLVVTRKDVTIYPISTYSRN